MTLKYLQRQPDPVWYFFGDVVRLSLSMSKDQESTGPLASEVSLTTKGGEEYCIRLTDSAYLLNDEGQTIETLHPSAGRPV